MTACRWTSKTTPRVIPGRHTDDCPGPALYRGDHDDHCTGCAPCPEHHCQVCDRTHVTVDGRGTDQTCGTCIAETRTALTQIGDYAARMLGEAIRRGINSHAAMLAGPTADPEAWGYRRMSAIAGRIDAAFLDDCHDEQHPAWVVGTWEILARDHLDQPRTYDPTLTQARDYLDRHLHQLAHDDGFDFAALHTALTACAHHLERVLHDGEQIEHGAPCLDCQRPLLKTTATDGRITYECPRCRRTLTENEYRLAVRNAYTANADRLTITDLVDRVGVPAPTLRRWASAARGEPPLLHPCGVNATGAKVYRVTAVEHLRDTLGARTQDTGA